MCLSNCLLGGVTSHGFYQYAAKVTHSLVEAGSGILTEIDAKNVIKEKPEFERRPYKILGACRPPFSYHALGIEPEIGTLLPCTVLVYEDEKGKATGYVINLEAALRLAGNPEIDEIAKEVKRRKIKNALVGL